jgi:hypothetical protein
VAPRHFRHALAPNAGFERFALRSAPTTLCGVTPSHTDSSFGRAQNLAIQIATTLSSSSEMQRHISLSLSMADNLGLSEDVPCVALAVNIDGRPYRFRISASDHGHGDASAVDDL